jgi:hypothetical protein
LDTFCRSMLFECTMLPRKKLKFSFFFIERLIRNWKRKIFQWEHFVIKKKHLLFKFDQCKAFFIDIQSNRCWVVFVFLNECVLFAN